MLYVNGYMVCVFCVLLPCWGKHHPNSSRVIIDTDCATTHQCNSRDYANNQKVSAILFSYGYPHQIFKMFRVVLYFNAHFDLNSLKQTNIVVTDS
jgi:hypothetical protein